MSPGRLFCLFGGGWCEAMSQLLFRLVRLTCTVFAHFNNRDLTAYGEAIRPLLSVMRAISKRRGVDLSQVAISWVMCKGVIPVVGCRTVAHVDSAAASLGWRLSSHEVDLLESAAVSYLAQEGDIGGGG